MGIQTRTAWCESKNVFVEHTNFACTAYQICEKLQQPQHSAAFAQAALHSLSLTWGFERLVHCPSQAERKNSMVPTSQRRSNHLGTLQEVLQDSHWQHVMPGAFSEATLKMLADCCKKAGPKSPYISLNWLMILKTHKRWSAAVASMWSRYNKLVLCALGFSSAVHKPMQVC